MWLSLSIYESKETNMNIQTAYNEWSESYDAHQNLTRDLDARVLRETLVNQKFDSILETGCGYQTSAPEFCETDRTGKFNP